MDAPRDPSRTTPYHLLGRGDQYRWWRPLAEMGLFAVLLGAFVLAFSGLAHGLAAVLGISSHEDGAFADPVFDIAFGFGIVVVALPAVLLAVRWAGRRPPGTLSTVVGRLRRNWLLDCLRWAAVAVVLVFLMGFLQDGWSSAKWPGWATWAQLAAISVLVVPFQAAAEEYVCRGWLLQAISSWTRSPWPAVVFTTVLFVGLHDYTDPLVLADLTIFSVAVCWLTIRTGGLEAAIALHVANNAGGMLLAATQGTPNLDQGGDYTVAQVLPSTAATLAYTWWVGRRARSRTEVQVPHRAAERAPHPLGVPDA